VESNSGTVVDDHASAANRDRDFELDQSAPAAAERVSGSESDLVHTPVVGADTFGLTSEVAVPTPRPSARTCKYVLFGPRRL